MERFYRSLFFLAFTSLWFLSSVNAQVALTAINNQYSQNFNSLAASGTANDMSTLPVGWTFIETGTNANTTYAAGTGSSNTGNTYSFGLDASDRSLGGLQSGSLVPTIGASFVNNTGTIINSLQIIYWGEQWRLGTINRGPDRLDFQYSLNASSLNTGTWTDIDSLDFNSPATTGTVGALVGNTNRKQRSFMISGLSIPAGATFFLRWLDFNVSGADDGLGIDDFSLTPIGVPPNQPSITLAPTTLNFGDVAINSSDTLTYKVTGANLDSAITISVANPRFTLSLDGVTFTSSIELSDSIRFIKVRFAPTTDGITSDSVIHVSGTVQARLFVKGNGFDQTQHIIPIATARTQPLGTKVTVAGRVTVGKELGTPAYIQDASGGIPVFDFTFSNSVAIGDSAIVTGPIGSFSNQVEISGAGIFFTKPSAPSRIIPPKAITIADLAANEGMLVTVQHVQLVNKSFVFYPQSTESMIDDSTHLQADLRIDGDTNIPGLTKPQGSVNITGVVGRFNANPQLLPRFAADIPGAVLPTTPADSIPKNKTLDVVNWNFEFFGAQKKDYQNQEFGPPNETLQMQNIRDVLRMLQPDIVAVEEVSNDSIFAVLVSQLPGYKSTCSNRWSYSFNGPDNTFPPQKVCFIYDTATVNVLSARPLFESRYDSARLIDSSLLPGCPGGAQSFFSSGRLPYWLTANVTINGVTEKISFSVVHAKSGGTAEDDRVRRLYDGQVLKDSLDAHHSNEKFIVLGDLNDDLDQSIVNGAASPYANYVADTARYIPITLALSNAGARSTTGFQDMIDHQIYSNELRDQYLQGSAQVITPFTLIPNYATTTSDHLPVMSRLMLKAPRVTFASSQVTFPEDSIAVHYASLVFDKQLSHPQVVSIAVGGTAAYGADYSTSPAVSNGVITLNVAAGAKSVSFAFTVINDNIDELAETAVFTIQPTAGVDIGAISQFTLIIEDNDVPTVSFADLLATVTEGSDHAVKLKLSTPPATDQSVIIQVFNGFKVDYGVDYTTSPDVIQNKIQLPIPAGSTDAQFTLTALDDHKREPIPEGVVFQLLSATSGLKLQQPLVSLVAILDAKKTHHFAVHPNPTFGAIQISGEECDGDEIINVVLRNSNGHVEYSGSGTLDRMSDAISNKLKHEHTGIYILSIQLDNEVVELRIVKL